MSYFTKFITLLFILVIAIACAPRQSQQSTSSDYMLTLEPMSTAVGQTMLMVTLTNNDGNPVNTATIEVKGNMTHAGMQPVLAQVTEGDNGVYAVPFEWTMGGDWFVEVNALLADGTTVSKTFEGFSILSEEMGHDDMNMEEEE